MHSISIFTTLVVIFAIALAAHGADPKTYYIDKSCKDRPEWASAWKTARNNARSVIQRLGAAADTDFERAVKKLFKVSRADPEFRRIRGQCASRSRHDTH